MELKDILLKLKTENGFTTEQLSLRSGVPKGTLNKLLNGQTPNPRGETLQKLAAALNCPADLFYSRNEHALYMHLLRNAEDILPPPKHPVPLRGETAAGEPRLMEEQFEFILCDDSLRGDFALKIHGDSMTGARLMDGDIVFIREQDDVDDGEIAAVILDDRITLKRVYHIKNGVQLLSMNEKHPPMIFTFDEVNVIKIVGKAIGFQSNL